MRALIVILAILAAAPAAAQSSGQQHGPASPEYCANRPNSDYCFHLDGEPGVTCYDPKVITGCPTHWIGSRGGGSGTAENCRNLPWCSEAYSRFRAPSPVCDDGSADYFVRTGGGLMAARAAVRQQPASRAGLQRCPGAPAAEPAAGR
jgi:hypothetical protein